MRLATRVILALVAGSAAAAARDAPSPALVLDCTEYPKTTDEAALVRRFGRENVVRAKLDGAEGETVPGTVIFPKDPTRRIEVSWAEPAKRRGLSGLTIRDRSGWQVRTPGGARASLGLRASLEDVEDANERPFKVNGFGWDYGGYANGWTGGKLDHMAGGCSLTARFNPDPAANGKALDRVSGEGPFGSSDPHLRAVRPYLSVIALDWPD